jgi:hypothetical protein
MAKRKKYDAHVRLYGYELDCPAYRTLSSDARALLVEFRALFNGTTNHIFLSVREMQIRLGGVGQRRATSARDELLSRGWIKLLEPGGFSRKVRHATTYMLTNEPAVNAVGCTKEYMRWRP